MMRDVLSTSEVAEVLECGVDNVRRLVRKGQLRAVITTRAGRLFARCDVTKLHRERQERGASTPRPPRNIGVTDE